jgi:hypothetical protein
MIPITIVLDARTSQVQVLAGHLLDGDLHALGKTITHGHVFYIANEMPGLFHLHSKGDNHLHLIISHSHVIEPVEQMPIPTIDTPATPGKHCCLPENNCLANVDGRCQCECCPTSC